MLNRALPLICLLAIVLLPVSMHAETSTALDFNCPVINSVTATPSNCDGNYNLTVDISYTGTGTMTIEVDGSVEYTGVPVSQQVIIGLSGDGTAGVSVDVTITETGCTSAIGSDTYNEPNCGCPTTLNLADTETGTITYQVSQTITSVQDVNAGANVTYDAGISITLNDGFHAMSGSTFTAMIGGCAAASIPALVETRTDEFEIYPIAAAEDLRMQVAPNPLQDVATISYEIPQRTPTFLHVFSVEGRLVKTLLNGAERAAGFYREDFDLSNLPAGNYFIYLRTGEKNIYTQIVITQ